MQDLDTRVSGDLKAKRETASIGEKMYQIMSELFPICRSLTGEGTLETLDYLKGYIPITIRTVPTATKVFDWEVPKEWNIKDAYVKNSKGEKIIDFRNSNLHVVSYSVPIKKNVSFHELKDHLYTLPDHPDWIPYRTSYYKEDWGFCMSHNQFMKLADESYEVCIDSTLESGHMAYGELVIRGESSDEVLITTHICHPSMCNDNLSGISVVTFLAKRLLKKRNRYTYRILFIPGTIGSITWLAVNELNVGSIKHGLTTALLGDEGHFTYKKSRRGNAEIDEVVSYVLKQENEANQIRDFIPFGYDERQFCSPGFNLPVGCLTRTPHGEFAEYHTSADNLNFVKPIALEESLNIYEKVIDVLEANRCFINVLPKCEPQLGKRGLYSAIGGDSNHKQEQLALLWVLNLSDGTQSMLDIAKKASIEFEVIKSAADQLLKAKLLREVISREDQKVLVEQKIEA